MSQSIILINHDNESRLANLETVACGGFRVTSRLHATQMHEARQRTELLSPYCFQRELRRMCTMLPFLKHSVVVLGRSRPGATNAVLSLTTIIQRREMMKTSSPVLDSGEGKK